MTGRKRDEWPAGPGGFPLLVSRPFPQENSKGPSVKHIAITAFITVLIVSYLAGCASAPEHHPPDIRVDVPAAWSTGGPEGAGLRLGDAEWWRGFNDEELNGLVQEALNNNYDLLGAAARVEQAAAIARIAGADLAPQASLGFQASRRRQNLIGIPIPGRVGIITTRSTSFGVSLDTSWELDLWGRIRKGKSAALADLEASWADLAALRLSIASQTVKAWFSLIEARLQVELAEQTVESYQASAEQVRSRYEEGVRTSLDVRLSLANLAGAQALLERRREQLDRSKRQMDILLGRYPAGVLEGDTDLPGIPEEIPSGLPSELLVRRPDLLAAERRFAAAEARVSEARRAFFPRLTLTASGGTLTEELEDLIDGDFGVWNIAAGIVQPIFQGGRLRANLAQSHAASDQALAQYATAILNAFGEVESALFSEQTLARQESFLAEATKQSDAARQLAERQYNAGLVDYITVLETQRRSLTSQSEYITVRRERLNARINLHLALGGGFELAEEWNQFLKSMSSTETEASVE
ncbi:MAG: efflux transporter outer membrane subunit [Candidatus Latescibacteria bacterium]|nr:efflux transporter outer membrane subunit [Candidatus Latescibacterota bacterium]NIO56197.1 efflux transporter outer membrane subunit [Candidatus Latescibacterota bacterium]